MFIYVDNPKSIRCNKLKGYIIRLDTIIICDTVLSP